MVASKYDRAKVPPYNGNDPLPSPGSLKALLFPPLLNEVQGAWTLNSIVWHPGHRESVFCFKNRESNKRS